MEGDKAARERERDYGEEGALVDCTVRRKKRKKKGRWGEKKKVESKGGERDGGKSAERGREGERDR